MDRMDGVNLRRRMCCTAPDRRKHSLHGRHPNHGVKALHPPDSRQAMLSGHGWHRMKPPHTGRSGRSLHRMNPVARMQCIHPVQCIHRTHSIHRKHCRRPKHRKHSPHSRRALHRTCCMHSTHPMRRMHRSRSVHLMHRSYALHRTHADHVPQRKHAAEGFPLLVTHRHSQAASGSCTLRVFAVILHPEPRSAARLSRATA